MFSCWILGDGCEGLKVCSQTCGVWVFQESSGFLGSSWPRAAGLAVLLSAGALPSRPGPARVSCARTGAPRKVQVMSGSHSRVGEEIQRLSADTGALPAHTEGSASGSLQKERLFTPRGSAGRCAHCGCVVRGVCANSRMWP